jgi:hypothetical protein
VTDLAEVGERLPGLEELELTQHRTLQVQQGHLHTYIKYVITEDTLFLKENINLNRFI